MSKHIFITGGVVSSLGKGLTSASLGMLLESHGVRIRMQKLDPYLNVDPGTMNPYQHGEVYVLDDGSETDLDLGHYERFTQTSLTKNCSWTTGKIYLNVIERERRGEYQGKTVQVIPHITDEIKRAIRCLETDEIDVVITEIGGTVGDIESLPFLEAIRQLSLDLGRENCLYIHMTLIPYLRTAGELKTKPTQHSVGRLREIGIQPDLLVCRTEHDLTKDEIEKIALFCNISTAQVITEKDCEFSIYEVPLLLAKRGFDGQVIERLHLPIRQMSDLSQWYDIMNSLRSPEREICIAVVGKYVKHKDAYKSIYEALDHAGIKNHVKIRMKRVESDSCCEQNIVETLQHVDGVLIPGGFGERGIEGKIKAIRVARENGIPFFGICLGMQCAVIEFARNVAGLENANSTEFDFETPHPVISLLAEQQNVTMLGGTMRLGKQPAILMPGTSMAKCYGTCEIFERHRHRYEFNNAYRKRLEESGLIPAGTSPDGTLVEAIEIPIHPWFVGVQYHPEFQSQPTAAHPLFDGFIDAAIRHKLTHNPT